MKYALTHVEVIAENADALHIVFRGVEFIVPRSEVHITMVGDGTTAKPFNTIGWCPGDGTWPLCLHNTN